MGKGNTPRFRIGERPVLRGEKEPVGVISRITFSYPDKEYAYIIHLDDDRGQRGILTVRESLLCHGPEVTVVRIPAITELTLLIHEISSRYKDEPTARFAIGDFLDALEERYAD